MSGTPISSVNQAIKLARLKPVSHHIQANGLAKDAVDVCYGSSKGRISSRRKTRKEKERQRRRIELVEWRAQEEGGEREKDTIGREERGKNIGRGRKGEGDRDEALANVAPAQVE